MSVQSATRSSNQPLGTSGDLRRRFLCHHVPVALASALVLVLFMALPLFDANTRPHGDLTSGTFARERAEGRPMDHGAAQTGAMDHGGGQTGSMGHGGGQTRSMGHGGGQTTPMRHGGDATGPIRQGGDPTGRIRRAGDPAEPGDRSGEHSGRGFGRQFTVASGYIALGLLALTLLIGSANLLLRRRTPISNYLTRDIGTWATVSSVVHVIYGLQLHGGGRIRDFLNYFIAPDGSPLTNSFGWGNWTGLAALVIVMGLFAISSDVALGQLKARRWKRLQRLNYALFALVVLHAFFYGALLRMTSPFTLLLVLSAVAVFVGQVMGIWLWRRRYSGGAIAVV